MDKIPFKERRVINALVVYSLLCRKSSPDLVGPSSSLLELIDRCSMGISFFRQVYHDLCSGSRSKYADFSESEFKRFLEAEYLQPVQIFVEYQARATVEERKEYEKRARADFDALGKEMAKATIRADLVELGRKRAELAPHTGVSYVYENHCWNCKKQISSAIDAQCSVGGDRAALGDGVEPAGTVHIERLNGALRDRLNALTCKTHAEALRDATFDALVGLQLFDHNFHRAHRALQRPLAADVRRYHHRSPAMALGLTNHRWSFLELLTTQITFTP